MVRYFFVFFLFIFSASVFPMDQNKDFRQLIEMPVVVDKEGCWDLFPKDDIAKFKVLKDCSEGCSDEIVCLENGTLAAFRTCLECLKNPEHIQELPIESLGNVFQLAHYYDASSDPSEPKGFCKQLAVQAYHCLPETSVTSEMKQYIVSIDSIMKSDGSIWIEKRKSQDFFDIFWGDVLDLRELNIDCLEGLKELADRMHNKGRCVRAIYLENNQLVEIDVDFIFTLFPESEALDVSENPLKKLKMSKILDGVEICAEYTDLRDVDSFLCGKNSRLLLSHNRFLSNDAKRNIKLAFTKSNKLTRFTGLKYRVLDSVPWLIIPTFTALWHTNFVSDAVKKIMTEDDYSYIKNIMGVASVITVLGSLLYVAMDDSHEVKSLYSLQ